MRDALGRLDSQVGGTTNALGEALTGLVQDVSLLSAKAAAADPWVKSDPWKDDSSPKGPLGFGPPGGSGGGPPGGNVDGGGPAGPPGGGGSGSPPGGGGFGGGFNGGGGGGGGGVGDGSSLNQPDRNPQQDDDRGRDGRQLFSHEVASRTKYDDKHLEA